jgi:hypothetical protein
LPEAVGPTMTISGCIRVRGTNALKVKNGKWRFVN